MHTFTRHLLHLRYILRLSFIKSEIDRLLLYSCMFSIAMVAARIWHTQEHTFIFMPWNLFLAIVPYGLLKMFGPQVAGAGKTIASICLFSIWLLFIPNTFYMITDLFHLIRRENIPLWFDLILLLSFAWNGFVLGTLSIRQMEKLLASKMAWLPGNLFVALIMLLNSFGVYLGRYLRFNSWDIITNPFQLFFEIAGLIVNPVEYKSAWAMILSFSLLMTLMYQMLKKLSRQLG